MIEDSFGGGISGSDDPTDDLDLGIDIGATPGPSTDDDSDASSTLSDDQLTHGERTGDDGTDNRTAAMIDTVADGPGTEDVTGTTVSDVQSAVNNQTERLEDQIETAEEYREAHGKTDEEIEDLAESTMSTTRATDADQGDVEDAVGEARSVFEGLSTEEKAAAGVGAVTAAWFLGV